MWRMRVQSGSDLLCRVTDSSVNACMSAYATELSKERIHGNRLASPHSAFLESAPSGQGAARQILQERHDALELPWLLFSVSLCCHYHRV